MDHMERYRAVRQFKIARKLVRLIKILMSIKAIRIIVTTYAEVSFCVAICILAALGFIVSFVAVAIVAFIFGIGFFGLIGACTGFIMAISIMISVSIILVIGSLFVPAGFFLVGGFFGMTVFSIVIVVVDLFPAMFLAVIGFLLFILLVMFV